MKKKPNKKPVTKKVVAVKAQAKKMATTRKVMKKRAQKKWHDLKDHIHPEADILSVIQKGIAKMKAIQKSALIALAAAAAAMSAAAQALAATADEEAAAPPKPPAAPPKPPAAPPFECKETVEIDGELRTCSKTTSHGANEHAFNKPKPAAATPPKKPTAATPPKKPTATPAAEPAATPAAEPGDKPLLEQAIEASKGFNELFGREELVKVLKKYLPEGKKTLPDVPEDKLPELIAELKG